MEISFRAAAFDQLGSRFISVYNGLETQKLCVSEVSSGATVHQALPKGVQISCLQWASTSEGQGQKKRKREVAGDENQDIVALGSTAGKILVYSVPRNEIIHVLETKHQAPVQSLAVKGNNLFSLVEDTLIKWDLVKFKANDSYTYDLQGLQASMATPTKLYLASTMPYVFNWTAPSEPIKTLPGFTTPIHQLGGSASTLIASGEEDRQIQIYGENENSSFMCPSNVVFFSADHKSEYIAVVCEDGQVRIYHPSGSQVSQITVNRSSGQVVAVHYVQFQDNFIILAWPEVGASVAAIKRVQWFDSEPIETVACVCDAKVATVSDHTSNGVDAAAPHSYNESQTAVSSGTNFRDFEDDEDEDDGEGEITLADRLEALEVNDDLGDDQLNVDDDESPPLKQTLKLSAPGSFAVLLSQSLSNDDKQLLETCLAERDERMIKGSIVQLNPALATKLLERLAEKISRTQHRSTRLLTWIRWVMIAHGGYLVTVPSLLKSLASLYSTLSARTATLPKLLALQGRLDLLNSQMDLRQEILDTKRSIDDVEDVPEFVYNEEEFIANGEEDLVGSDFDDDDEDDENEEVEEDDIADEPVPENMDDDVPFDSDQDMDEESE